MAGDDSDSDSDSEDDTNPHTTKKSKKSDPAIYKASKEDEDDGVLFTMPAAWNRFSVVLRDSGVLRFVKYVSRSAKGDRWDVIGEWGVAGDDGEDAEVEGDVRGGEEEWKGIETDGSEGEDGREGVAGEVVSEVGEDEDEDDDMTGSDL
jgi:hypothetical protein